MYVRTYIRTLHSETGVHHAFRTQEVGEVQYVACDCNKEVTLLCGSCYMQGESWVTSYAESTPMRVRGASLVPRRPRPQFMLRGRLEIRVHQSKQIDQLAGQFAACLHDSCALQLLVFTVLHDFEN